MIARIFNVLQKEGRPPPVHLDDTGAAGGTEDGDPGQILIPSFQMIAGLPQFSTDSPDDDPGAPPEPVMSFEICSPD